MRRFITLIENASREFVPEDHFKLIHTPGDLAQPLHAIEKRARAAILPALGIRDMTVFLVAPGEFDGAFGVYVGGTWQHPMIGLDLERHRRETPDRDEMILQIEGTLAHELAHAFQDKRKHIKGEDADEDGAEAFAYRWVTERIVDTTHL